MTLHTSSASPFYHQDDEINLSWNMEYVPYMIRQDSRKQNPDLDEEMAELDKTHKREDRHFYSAMLESLNEQYREENPDAPDKYAEAQAEYDAYMAANPGLKERLIEEEREERDAAMCSEAELWEMVKNEEETA